MKRTISVLLSLALLFTLAPAAGAFSDIQDLETAQEVAVLRMMGVIDGISEERFAPEATLTRAQFCKMAVIFKGDGEQEPLYRGRTIFPDVRSTHWARGYINLAVSTTIGAGEDGKGGVRLIRGMGDGTFQPDRSVSYAEALAILLRLLGYTDADAGMNWPAGYLSLAAKTGLSEGLSLAAGQPLTRAQAAHLFYEALGTKQKNGTEYYNTRGTATAGVLLLDHDATTADGTRGAVKTTVGTFLTAEREAPAELLGCRGVLVRDQNDKAVLLLPRGAQERIVVRDKKDKDGSGSVQAASITDEDGQKHPIPSDAAVYTTDSEKSFEEAWTDLRAGTPLTLYYDETGEVIALYLGTAPQEDVVVAYRGASDVQRLVEGVGAYSVYRDGVTASLQDICKYDVAVYDPAGRILTVSSARLTGRYDNAAPNPRDPKTITVLGAKLEVLDRAREDLMDFQPGDEITVLLTPDNRVAGVVSKQELREENIGIVEALGEGAKVKLLNGIELSGQTSSRGAKVGDLVSVRSAEAGTLGIGGVLRSASPGTLDLAAGTLGTAKLLPGCRFYDRAANGTAVEVSKEALIASGAGTRQLTYVHKTTGGAVDLLIFEGATGEAYRFGKIKRWNTQIDTGKIDENGDPIYQYTDHYAVIDRDAPTGSGDYESSVRIAAGKYAGILLDADDKITQVIELTAKKDVRRGQFRTEGEVTYVDLGSRSLRVANNVQCYNETTELWFDSLDEARAYAETMTVYYDKTPETGGQVRIVVVE